MGSVCDVAVSKKVLVLMCQMFGSGVAPVRNRAQYLAGCQAQRFRQWSSTSSVQDLERSAVRRASVPREVGLEINPRESVIEKW